MPDGQTLAAAIPAAIVATLGLWWFHFMMKGFMGRQPRATRLGVYALIWLAYFVLVMLLALRQAGGGA